MGRGEHQHGPEPTESRTLDELGDTPTQRIEHGASLEPRPDGNQNEGWRNRRYAPRMSRRFRAMRQRKAASMSAEQLKRKLRNFPTAKLSERLAA
jgi:hypothetical protein